MPYSQRTEGLNQLRRELAELPDKILDEGEKIVGRGMLNIKKGAQQRVRVNRWAHLPHLARSFSYDVTKNRRLIRGEAGADREKLQGELDIYVDQGTVHNAASNHWGRAFDEELPKFEKYAEEYLARLVQ